MFQKFNKSHLCNLELLIKSDDLPDVSVITRIFRISPKRGEGSSIGFHAFSDM